MTTSAVLRAARTAATSFGTSLAEASPGDDSPAVHAAARLSSSTEVAPSIAIRSPWTVATHGWNAAAASDPMPTTGKPAARAAAIESARPTRP